MVCVQEMKLELVNKKTLYGVWGIKMSTRFLIHTKMRQEK